MKPSVLSLIIGIITIGALAIGIGVALYLFGTSFLMSLVSGRIFCFVLGILVVLGMGFVLMNAAGVFGSDRFRDID
jgi:hypothetical protein